MSRSRAIGSRPDLPTNWSSQLRAVISPPIGFPVFQDLHRPDPAVGLEGDRVVDDEMFADHVVDDEEAQEAPVPVRLPHLLAARAHLLAREPLDCLDVGGTKHDVRLDELVRRGEGNPLSLLDGQIAMGVRR